MAVFTHYKKRSENQWVFVCLCVWIMFKIMTKIFYCFVETNLRDIFK